MTPIQKENWAQFAERMAWETHRWHTPERQRKAVERVRNWLAAFWSNYHPREVIDWDGNGSECYPGDDFSRYMGDDGLDFWHEKRGEIIEGDFGSHVMCCVRAGFDVAVQPSGGVISERFTAGMIRRMFPEGLPPYVDAFFHGPGVNPDAPHFDTLPNDRMIWL